MCGDQDTPYRVLIALPLLLGLGNASEELYLSRGTGVTVDVVRIPWIRPDPWLVVLKVG